MEWSRLAHQNWIYLFPFFFHLPPYLSFESLKTAVSSPQVINMYKNSNWSFSVEFVPYTNASNIILFFVSSATDIILWGYFHTWLLITLIFISKVFLNLNMWIMDVWKHDKFKNYWSKNRAGILNKHCTCSSEKNKSISIFLSL
jgi:hypothetical protein